MIPDPTVAWWQKAILKDCERTLGRAPTGAERAFITSRGGFLAVEAIHDHVKSPAADPVILKRYLNSGAATPGA